MNVEGSNNVQLTSGRGGDFPMAWSPDGENILFSSDRDGEDFELYIMNADGSNPLKITRNKMDETDVIWSPDGTKIFAWPFGGKPFIINPDGSNPTELETLPGSISISSNCP